MDIVGDEDVAETVAPAQAMATEPAKKEGEHLHVDDLNTLTEAVIQLL